MQCGNYVRNFTAFTLSQKFREIDAFTNELKNFTLYIDLTKKIT